jgi:hypothetical protein
MEVGTLRQIGKRPLHFDSLANDVKGIDPSVPSIWPDESGQHFHGGGFARAIRAHKQRDFTRFRHH